MRLGGNDASDGAQSAYKPAFHDTDTDILATILARMSAKMSVSWNAALYGRGNVVRSFF